MEPTGTRSKVSITSYSCTPILIEQLTLVVWGNGVGDRRKGSLCLIPGVGLYSDIKTLFFKQFNMLM